ncbi:cell division protein FtsQ [Salirhabdus euzebyi]|uniref:Cell division protein DivIB n=1 Tax=Salirhabdus euzebyi TaxID=394506 RepID=A0A841Q9X1_9BACI|nr:FtsQ-type POTRA domain-containing protein [Salirhabdus euzebyi]MBB6455032.1 cell division protein FtsQ [Salirhabdus euzebyi]
MADKKIVSIEDRIPKLKAARKKKANRRLVFYLFLFFILILIILYLQSPLSHVKHIVVQENTFLETGEIINQSELKKGSNIWNLKFEEIENSILELPEIKNVEIRRKLPNTVEIKVEEYLRVGYVKYEGSFFPILENGQALKNKPVDTPGGDAPILIGWENSTYLAEMTKELRSLNNSLSAQISEIHWAPEDTNPYKIQLYMVNGREVIASIRNFSDKMRAYPSIAAQIDPEQKGVIHIDLGAFFVPYGETIEEDMENAEEGESVE